MSVDIDTRRSSAIYSRRNASSQSVVFFLVVFLCFMQAATLAIVLTWEIRFRKMESAAENTAEEIQRQLDADLKAILDEAEEAAAND